MRPFANWSPSASCEPAPLAPEKIRKANVSAPTGAPNVKRAVARAGDRHAQTRRRTDVEELVSAPPLMLNATELRVGRNELRIASASPTTIASRALPGIEMTTLPCVVWAVVFAADPGTLLDPPPPPPPHPARRNSASVIARRCFIVANRPAPGGPGSVGGPGGAFRPRRRPPAHGSGYAGAGVVREPAGEVHACRSGLLPARVRRWGFPLRVAVGLGVGVGCPGDCVCVGGALLLATVTPTAVPPATAAAAIGTTAPAAAPADRGRNACGGGTRAPLTGTPGAGERT